MASIDDEITIFLMRNRSSTLRAMDFRPDGSTSASMNADCGLVSQIGCAGDGDENALWIIADAVYSSAVIELDYEPTRSVSIFGFITSSAIWGNFATLRIHLMRSSIGIRGNSRRQLSQTSRPC